MLTLSILWVVLAATVTMIATMRKTPAMTRQEAGTQVCESGHVLTFLAVIYGVVLLGCFVYIGKFLVSSL
jgi:hypothetical protein